VNFFDGDGLAGKDRRHSIAYDGDGDRVSKTAAGVKTI
jgi:hypothetical protein